MRLIVLYSFQDVGMSDKGNCGARIDSSCVLSITFVHGS